MCNKKLLASSLSFVTFAVLAAGCAGTGAPGGVGGGSDDGAAGPHDLSRPRDLGGTGGGDQAGVDQAGGKQPDFAGTNADLSTLPDLVVPPDLAPRTDLIIPGKGVGEICNADGECASNKCLDEYQGNKFCVAPCKAMGDCAGYMTSFCEPESPGSPNGWCIPRHAAHCASCDKDADCGSLAERCLIAPGDLALACHIDCAIDGANACPNDYTCTPVQDGNTMRKLCLPNSKICLDAIGGYCDRISLPQNCARQNASGACSGQRQCLANAKRYDKCGAMSPQYLANCQAQNPAGCMLLVDPNVLNTKANCGGCGKACAQGQDCCSLVCTPLNTIQNCGACGKVCPGQTNTSDALCTNMVCDMTCRVNNYDVDKSPNNGCEVPDAVPPGHTQQTASLRPRPTATTATATIRSAPTCLPTRAPTRTWMAPSAAWSAPPPTTLQGWWTALRTSA